MQAEFLSDMIILKIDSVYTMYNEKGAGSKRRNRPLWALVIKYEGETFYTSGKNKYVSDINNIAVLPKGSDYDWVCTKSGHFSMIEFECEKTCPGIFSFSVKNGEEYLDTVRKMEKDRALKKPGYKLDGLKDLYGLISSLVKAENAKYIPSAKKEKIRPAIEYIAENYDKHISNDELASAAGISTVYFRKLFRENVGMSPSNYILRMKMKKAEEMLKSDYSSITDIAYSLGYNNVYEFSRAFKKHMGKPPLKYAGEHR